MTGDLRLMYILSKTIGSFSTFSQAGVLLLCWLLAGWSNGRDAHQGISRAPHGFCLCGYSLRCTGCRELINSSLDGLLEKGPRNWTVKQPRSETNLKICKFGSMVWLLIFYCIPADNHFGEGQKGQAHRVSVTVTDYNDTSPRFYFRFVVYDIKRPLKADCSVRNSYGSLLIKISELPISIIHVDLPAKAYWWANCTHHPSPLEPYNDRACTFQYQ